MEYPDRLCTLAAVMLEGVSLKLAAAGMRVVAPPLASHWVDPSRWRLLVKLAWERDEHINVLEARTVLNYVRHLGRSATRRQMKHLVFTDSTVAIGALSKGRSSAPPLLALCRRLLVLRAICGIRLYLRHVPSPQNSADGPTRDQPVGPAKETVEKYAQITTRAQG